MRLIKSPVSGSHVNVVVGSRFSVSGLTEEQKLQIKRGLTFNNPAFDSVKKYSRYSYTNVPPYLMYYIEKSGHLEIPLGYPLKDVVPSFSFKDERVSPHVSFPSFVLTLRKDQKLAADSYLSKCEDISLSSCIQMPTGKGKSILGLYLASRLSVKTLVVVHKTDLVRGWKKDITLAFDGKVIPGIIQSKNRKVGSLITIATVQTLNLLSPEELNRLYSTFGFVIQDEMHHCPASSFEVVSNFNSKYRLGLTATPERTDGLEHIMNLYYGSFCFRAYNKEEDEDILSVLVKTRSVPIYCDPLYEKFNKSWRLKDVSFPKEKELEDGCVRYSEIPYDCRPKLHTTVVDDFIVRSSLQTVLKDILYEYNQGHSCIVFLSLKEHVRLFEEALVDCGCLVGTYYGDNTDKENTETLDKAESIRKFITVTTYSKASESTNVKQWEVAFLVSSIKNGKNVEQSVGRVRRRTKSAKLDQAVVYDYRYPNAVMLRNHGSYRDSRYKDLHFSTDSPPKKKGLFSRGFSV